jgi:predicted metal-dependent hydrolase
MQKVNLLGTPEYIHALELWNQGQFWEVHEALEPLWRKLSGLDRELTHGIILLAAALHKARTSERGGWRNFDKALKRLHSIPEVYQGIRVAELIQEVRRKLERSSYHPGFPLL